MHKEIIGNSTLYLGDCLEILPTLPKVDAVITDPPYGINVNKKKAGTIGSGGYLNGRYIPATVFPKTEWNDEKIGKQFFDEIFKISENQIIFGGNYYIEYLKNTPCWIVWNKETNGYFADCELAWTSFDTAVRKFTYRWNGFQQGTTCQRIEKREHPTQKPIPLMEWIIDNYSDVSMSILDPFMGSGTTGVACMNLRRQFIGIEIEPKYFDIACRRIEQAQQQLSLFDEPEFKKPEQVEMNLAGERKR